MDKSDWERSLSDHSLDVSPASCFETQTWPSPTLKTCQLSSQPTVHNPPKIPAIDLWLCDDSISILTSMVSWKTSISPRYFNCHKHYDSSLLQSHSRSSSPALFLSMTIHSHLPKPSTFVAACFSNDSLDWAKIHVWKIGGGLWLMNGLR